MESGILRVGSTGGRNPGVKGSTGGGRREGRKCNYQGRTGQEPRRKGGGKSTGGGRREGGKCGSQGRTGAGTQEERGREIYRRWVKRGWKVGLLRRDREQESRSKGSGKSIVGGKREDGKRDSQCGGN